MKEKKIKVLALYPGKTAEVIELENSLDAMQTFVGGPIDPDTITACLSDFSHRHDLPHINPHAFRHSGASILISTGTDVVTVSKMLGHSDVTATGNIYVHVIEESKSIAGNLLAESYFKG